MPDDAETTVNDHTPVQAGWLLHQVLLPQTNQSINNLTDQTLTTPNNLHLNTLPTRLSTDTSAPRPSLTRNKMVSNCNLRRMRTTPVLVLVVTMLLRKVPRPRRYEGCDSG